MESKAAHAMAAGGLRNQARQWLSSGIAPDLNTRFEEDLPLQYANETFEVNKD
jgi:hypothetical protein